MDALRSTEARRRLRGWRRGAAFRESVHGVYLIGEPQPTRGDVHQRDLANWVGNRVCRLDILIPSRSELIASHSTTQSHDGGVFGDRLSVHGNWLTGSMNTEKSCRPQHPALRPDPARLRSWTRCVPRICLTLRGYPIVAQEGDEQRLLSGDMRPLCHHERSVFKRYRRARTAPARLTASGPGLRFVADE
jgi:hypothetical protein